MPKAISLGLLSIVVSLVISPPPLSAQDKVRIGISAFSPTNGAVWVTEDRAIFKKHGIEAEVIFMGGGAARGVNALIAGDIQFATAGGGAAITASLRGSDVVMVASVNNKGIQRLMVRPEIKTPEALKGRKIGITMFGSSSHAVLLMMLKAWGIRQDEVQVLQIGPSPTMLISLEKGGIDGAVLTDPSFFIAEDKGFRTLADLANMEIYYLQSMLVTTRSYLRSNRDQANRVLKAYVEGIAYFKKNKKESVKVLMKRMRMEPEQERYAERSHEQYAAHYFDRVPYPSLVGIKTVLELVAKDHPKAKGADPNSFMDTSLLKALDESGYIRTLYQ